MADTVKMKRDKAQFPDGPTTADVNVEEVENMTAYDWYPDTDATKDAANTKGKKSADAEPTG